MKSISKDCPCDEIVILDFETTGLSPQYERIIEVAAAIVKSGEIVDTFTHLMYPGRHIPYFITSLTGITNEMVKGKPAPEIIMPKLNKFIGKRPIVAHNASFDKRFLYAEMERANIVIDNPVLCSMVLARKLIPNAFNYKLTTLTTHLKIKPEKAHRALSDVHMTAKIWNHLYVQVSERAGVDKPDLSLLVAISKRPKATIDKYFEKIRQMNVVQ